MINNIAETSRLDIRVVGKTEISLRDFIEDAVIFNSVSNHDVNVGSFTKGFVAYHTIPFGDLSIWEKALVKHFLATDALYDLSEKYGVEIEMISRERSERCNYVFIKNGDMAFAEGGTNLAFRDLLS